MDGCIEEREKEEAKRQRKLGRMDKEKRQIQRKKVGKRERRVKRQKLGEGKTAADVSPFSCLFCL